MAKRKQQRYTDEQKAIALAVLAVFDNNYKKTSRETGIPPRTLKHWSSNGVRSQSAELLPIKKQQIQSLLMEHVITMLGVMDKKKYRDASITQLYTSIGIALDKVMVLDPDYVPENESTTINIQTAAKVDYRLDPPRVTNGSIVDQKASGTD